MTELPPAPSGTQDTLFGEMHVRIEGQERVTVSGENVPTTVLERDPASEADAQIAIGTRDAAHLTLTVDGVRVPLWPARGRLRRRTYRVETEYDGARYALVPDSVPSSRLTRDGTRLGDFSSDGDETVVAEWVQGHTAPTARPADASIGYALAAAFGTGGQPAWMMLADMVSAAIP
ncbi:hypothetical protein ACFQ6U_16505 [Streptomyces sp. NPDC056465]|uniref:hypothetical protein n=1 Tax=unclassified Streptomyces TaxID=2593676 RepID=UPI0035DA1105